MMAKLIFGCGYVGRRVAMRWLADGETVYAVTRSSERAKEFQSLGIHPIVADITEPASLDVLASTQSGGQTPEGTGINDSAPNDSALADSPTTFTTVLFAVGFDRSSGDTIERVYVEGLGNVLATLDAESVNRFIYISSTGVYGQNDGEWIDEDSECVPSRDGGRACLAAERLLAAHLIGRRAVVLRLAGIYGPDRVPRKRDLEQQAPMPVSNGFLNLIHVDDAVDVVLATEGMSSEDGKMGEGALATFLVSDGTPVKRCDYYSELARLLDIPPPNFCTPDEADQPLKARRLGSKRVRNTRLLNELKLSLNYPSYREGLAAILAVVDDEVDAERGES